MRSRSIGLVIRGPFFGARIIRERPPLAMVAYRSFLEVQVSRQQIGATDNSRKIQRCGIQKVASGAGERRERGLLIEHIVDDQTNLEGLAHIIADGRIDEPPMAYREVVLRELGVEVVEIHRAD